LLRKRYIAIAKAYIVIAIPTDSLMPGLLALDRNELSFADYQAATFRPGFDGLRGIGFLLV